jgi:hypothetical protein
MTMKRILSLFVLAALLGCVTAHAQGVATGDPAPAFELSDTYGNDRSLGDYQGKWVVLEWVNHGCPFVKKHYSSGNMQALQEKYGGQGIVWLSICSSAKGKQGYYPAGEWNSVTAQKGAVPEAVLLDPQGVVGRLYNAKTTPHMFVIDPQGTVVYQGAIDDTPSANPADIPTSKNYVSLALDDAIAGRSVAISSTDAYGCSVKY